MLGNYGIGSIGFAGTSGATSAPRNRIIAVLGDKSTHGGTLISHNQNGNVTVNNIPVCVNNCSHSCPITGHGTTNVTAVTTKSFINNKLIITEYAYAGCGARIIPIDRKVSDE